MRRALVRALDGPAWPWLLLGLALRVAFALKLGGALRQFDEYGYDSIARQFALDGTVGTEGPGVVPLVPALLFGSLYRLCGGMSGARVGLAALGAALPWLVGRLTESVAGARAGRLALALAAVYPFFIYYSGLLMSESPYLLLSVAGLWLLCESLGGRGGLARPAAAGLCLALAALTRTEAAYVLLPVWAAGAALCAARRWSWPALGAALLCFSLPLAGWALRNRGLVGAMTLDTHGGMALVHGVLYFDENDVDTSLAAAAFERSQLYRDTRDLPEYERDAALKRAALCAMAEHPGRTLRQWARKFLRFWRFYPRTGRYVPKPGEPDPSAGAAPALLVAVSLLTEPALVLGGLAGLWALRRGWTVLLPLWLWTAATMALHVLSVSQMRYRLPVMPALLAGFAALVAPRLRARNGSRRGRGATESTSDTRRDE